MCGFPHGDILWRMSTTTYTVSDFLRAAPRQRQALETALQRLERLKSENGARTQDLQRQFDEAASGLARLILPAFTADAVRKAGKRSAYAPLLSSDPLAAMEAERKRLEADLARMEADPLYADRMALRGPGVGKLPLELKNLEEYRSSLAGALQRADHPRLERLLSVGYGTGEYKVGWWRWSYYADWKAGDEILEKFPDQKAFGDLRTVLLKMRDDLAVFDQRIAELRGDILAGERLEKDRDAAALRLSTLPDIHLADWRQRIGKHVLSNPEVVADRLAGEPDMETLLKTCVGLRKKIEYLDGLAAAQLDLPAEGIRAEIAKLEHDRVKFSRPKRAGTLFPAEAFEKRFRDRGDRLNKHFQRYEAAARSISDFTDYRRASFAADFLWWDLMTDGRIDGDFLPEVEAFRRAHPDHSWHSDGFEDDRAAAAAAAADYRGPDPVGTVDAS